MSTTSGRYFLLLFIPFVTIACIYIAFDNQYVSAISLQTVRSIFVPRKPIIMAWTTWFSIDWVGNNRKLLELCPRKCEMVHHNETIIDSVDAFLFHTRNMNTPPKRRLPNQLYVFWMWESPVHVGGQVYKLPRNFFNASVTYRKDSTYPYPYFRLKEYEEEAEKKSLEEIEARVANKTKAAVMFSSNCRTNSKREVYVKELSRYTDVRSYGACFKTNKTFPRNNPDSTEFLSSHMFYLAFENSVCMDYITEKFYNARYLVVPVVLKRAIYKNYIPDDMYIAADDFESPKALGEYMNYLTTNTTAYMEYFAWTQKYEVVTDFPEICQLCEDLYEKTPRQIPNIVDHFITSSKCDGEFAQKLLKPKQSVTIPYSSTLG